MVMKSKPKHSRRLIRTKEIIISNQAELEKMHVNVFSAGKRLIRCSFVSGWVREWCTFSRRQEQDLVIGATERAILRRVAKRFAEGLALILNSARPLTDLSLARIAQAPHTSPQAKRR